MATKKPTTIISHWNHMVPGMQQSSAEFYGTVDRLLQEHRLDGAKIDRVNLSEGGLLSSKREYLQVRRKEHVFHVCAAPFGNGFFVSWWLGEIESGLFASLMEIPYLGPLLGLFKNIAKPLTYYRVDTLMFQSVTHGAVLDALDSAISAKGMRAIADAERKPAMRDFFTQMGG